MKGRKFLAAGICGMVVLGMMQSASAAGASSNNPVPVSYDYSGAAEPVSPNYSVVIPTGLVFTTANANTPLDVSVSMMKAPGESDIIGSCKATVSVKSANGYKVALTGNKDAVEYVVKYGDTTLEGTDPTQIGTLSKGVTDETPNTTIVGSAKLNGVATKTGAHTDTLTYTITNVAVSGS